jgi:hypothetical protein
LRETPETHDIIFKLVVKNKNNSQVNHKNKKRDDNRLENLEWVTPSENMSHAKSSVLN